ncbi:MAG: GTPase Era [Pseudomonadota bacterium]
MELRCGYVAIVGRPNVGKSTLQNRILDQKLSITSRKPQTTRHQLLGIKTEGSCQALYVDTPGIHGREEKAINRYMNRSARSVLRDVDTVIFVIDRTEWGADDELVAQLIEQARVTPVVVVNKVDLLKDKSLLLPHLQKLQARFPDSHIVPLSAEQGDNVDTLEQLVLESLPEGPFLFPVDQLTDRTERFLIAEIIREKMMRQLGDELPYALTLQIDNFVDKGKSIHIDATAFVERDGQKAILIGKSGERIKRIGTDARVDIERLLDRKVMLRLWVKVRSGWSDDERALRSLGYDDV